MTAESVVENVVVPDDVLPEAPPFLDLLVIRLSAEYGVEPQVMRTRCAEAFAVFAGARVQSFVPILIEKRLRAMLRAERGPGRTLAEHEESQEAAAPNAGAGRRPM